MEKLSKISLNLLKYAILIALVFVLVSSVNCFKIISFEKWYVSLGILLFGAAVAITATMFLKIKKSTKLLLILLIAFVVRLIWLLNAKSVLISDFATVHDAAKEFLAGNKMPMREYGYLARFPHLIPMMLYMAGIMVVSPGNYLIVIHAISLVLSVVTVFMMYRLAKHFVKNDTLCLVCAGISAIYPSFVCYTSTFCTETLAVPLFLISVDLFFCSLKSNKKNLWLFIAGISLYISNLFRAVGIVFLIAVCIYILLFSGKGKIKSLIAVILAYFLTAVTISGILIGTDVIDKPLWKGSEPSFATLMLKGSNFEHRGMWNLDDAKFVEANLKNDNLSQLCFDKIKERLSEKSVWEIVSFYSLKFDSQWSVGDCSGSYWAVIDTDLPIAYPLPTPSQIIYIIVLVLSLFFAFNKKNSPTVSFLCLLLCGFGILFILLETQGRYSYIVSWIFVLLAVSGLEYLIDSKDKAKDIYIKHKEKANYIIFGVVTTISNVLTYWLFYDILHIGNIASTIIAWFVSVAVAYITNKIWVFESKSFEKAVLKKEIPSFFSCRAATGVVDVMIMWLAVDIMTLPATPIKIISNIIVIILNYIASKIYVFKQDK